MSPENSPGTPNPNDAPHVSPFSALRTVVVCALAVFAALPVLLATPAGARIGTSSPSGRDYVSDENVAKFYGFERFAKQDDDRIFKHPSLIMTWKIGSESIYVNNIKFCLSFPVIENGAWPCSRPSTSPSWSIPWSAQLHPQADRVRHGRHRRGHGAHDTGAKGPYGREKDYTLDTAQRLSKALQARGFKTVMTRNEDVFLTLGQRVEVANRYKKRDLHQHPLQLLGCPELERDRDLRPRPAGDALDQRGSPWNSPLTGNVSDAENIALATAVHAHVISEIKAVDRGIKRARFNVLRGINNPAFSSRAGS